MALPRKNLAYSFNVALVDAGNRPSLRANPTLAAGDVRASTDEGAFANLATLPVVSPAGGVQVTVSLSAGEMNGERIGVLFVDQTAPKEWDDLYVLVEPGADELVDLVWDELLTGLTHNIVNSAGRIMRELKEGLVSFEGTGSNAGASTLDLSAGASASVDFYKPGLIVVLSSFGTQFRRIEAYSGAPTRRVTVATPWVILPNDGDDVKILPWASVRVSDIDLAAAQAIADAILKRDWTALAGEPAFCLLMASRFPRNKWLITPGGILRVFKEDGLTVAFESQLTTTPGADPVTQGDPL